MGPMCRVLSVLLGVALFAAGPLFAAVVDDASELRLGSVAMDIPAEMHRRLTPLTKYLSDTLKRPVSLKLSSSMSAAIDEVSNGSVELEIGRAHVCTPVTPES